MREYYKNEEVTKIPFELWYNDKIKELKEDIEYNIKKWKEEVERISRRNKWLKDLRESLK